MAKTRRLRSGFGLSQGPCTSGFSALDLADTLGARMKLYTKNGDDGSTGLIGNVRVAKCDPRVSAYGEVDETNAAIGLVIAQCDDKPVTANLRRIQADLFMLGAELATPADQVRPWAIKASHVTQLENWIDEASAISPPMKNFVLPGGHPTAARLHFARTVCRRAERSVVSLTREQAVGEWVVPYLNRLSDFLFALARAANTKAGIDDLPWTPSP